MKKLISLITLISVIAISIPGFAYDAVITLKSAVADPVNKTVILSGNINIGGDRPIYVEMIDDQGKLIYADSAISNTAGDFSLAIGVDGLEGESYDIYARYRENDKVKLYTFEGMGDVSPVPISAEVTKGYVFMENETDIDTKFNTAVIQLKNAKTIPGTILSSGYTLSGLPQGMQANLTAVSDSVLNLTFTGRATESVSENHNISISLKSNIILSGNANTDSQVIGGITLYPYEYGQRVITDKNSAGFKMETFNTPSSSAALIEIQYRNITADGLLVKGTHFDYSEHALSGMSITAAADKSTNKIQLTLTGSSKQSIRNNIVINDFVFKNVIAENADLDSEPISINITAATAQNSVSSPGGGGGGGGGGASGGGSVIQQQPSVSITPDVPIIPATLTDIENHWGKSYIDKLNSLGYISGYEDNTYRPDNNITRAEFTALVIRILNTKTVKYNNSYSDISDKDWYADYVETALSSGLVSEDETFRPQDNIRRDELVKIAVCAYLLSHETPTLNTPLSNFMDAGRISEWAKEYVHIGLNLGLIRGDSDRNFNADSNATRAESAAILSRLIDCLSL